MPKRLLRTLLLCRVPRFTRFVTLKISHRAWSRAPLWSLNSFRMFRSSCAIGGRRPLLRPQDPMVPLAGVAKAVAAFVMNERVVLASGNR